eukprot:scaffold30241_cov89-Isochrysis_galbana.AAC.4
MHVAHDQSAGRALAVVQRGRAAGQHAHQRRLARLRCAEHGKPQLELRALSQRLDRNLGHHGAGGADGALVQTGHASRGVCTHPAERADRLVHFSRR